MNKKSQNLAIIPARFGSKRIPNKNIKKFMGKPLLAYTIEQALVCPFIDRVIVDTDSPKIAKIAKKFGAEVPFLRPPELAQDNSKIIDSVLYMIERLEKDEKYLPENIFLLQTTSPLRELKDIENCWKLMQSPNTTTVLTICPTHPRLYHIKPDQSIVLVNGSENQSSNTQAWPQAYILNGCFVYIVKRNALLKEKRIITQKTKAIICPKWRSVDLDSPEEWVLAEFLYKNKREIEKKIKNL